MVGSQASRGYCRLGLGFRVCRGYRRGFAAQGFGFGGVQGSGFGLLSDIR